MSFILYLPIDDLLVLSLMVLTCLLVAGTMSLISICSYGSQGCPPGAPAETNAHYVRKAHLRCACMKNGDAQITRLRRRVSHYRVIKDARPDASLISIHGRRAMSERVTYLISNWDPMPLI
jgi:hypothetical protein